MSNKLTNNLVNTQYIEPVAIRYDFDGYGYQYMDSGSGSDWQTRVEGEFLYTHPAKTLTPLTEDECEAIINRHDWFSKSWREMAKEIHDAILRKAQENPLQDKLDAIANKVVFGKAQEK